VASEVSESDGLGSLAYSTEDTVASLASPDGGTVVNRLGTSEGDAQGGAEGGASFYSDASEYYEETSPETQQQRQQQQQQEQRHREEMHRLQEQRLQELDKEDAHARRLAAYHEALSAHKASLPKPPHLKTATVQEKWAYRMALAEHQVKEFELQKMKRRAMRE